MLGAPRPTVRIAAEALALLALVACGTPAGQPASEPIHTRWVREDGSTPTREEFDAAASSCDARVNEEGLLRGRRNRYVDWGVRMIACMNDEGYTRRAAPEAE